MTNATYLKFWHKYETNIGPQNPIVRMDPTGDAVTLWSQTGVATTTFEEVIIDVIGYSGTHEIEFSFEVLVS